MKAGHANILFSGTLILSSVRDHFLKPLTFWCTVEMKGT
jgi:hypothetical protein